MSTTIAPSPRGFRSEKTGGFYNEVRQEPQLKNNPLKYPNPIRRWSTHDIERMTNPTKDRIASPFKEPIVEAPSLSAMVAPQLIESPKVAPPPLKSVAEKARAAITVLNRYRIEYKNDWDVPAGVSNSQSMIEDFISRNESIELILPAFPFKSSNKSSKVLGDLPDEAERVSLMHLDGICQAIEDASGGKAHLTIISDGIMYNDLLGVPDIEVWRFGQSLRNMAAELGCTHIQFSRVYHLLGPKYQAQDLTEESYLAMVSEYRQAIDKDNVPEDYNAIKEIANDPDVAMTYRGYRKFLDTERDVKTTSKSKFEKESGAIGKAMLRRGKAFALAISKTYPKSIRLSIHPSADTKKISISLLPQDNESIMTPWHGAVVRKVDGTITMAHALSVSAMTHRLIYENGRPMYFRERSDLFEWPGMDLEFTYLYPTGIMVKPQYSNVSYTLQMVDMQKIRLLAEQCSPIVLRGFANTLDRRAYIAKAYDLGEVLPWKSGIVQEVKNEGNKDPKSNSVVSNEAMPMHFDGMFKLKKVTDEQGKEKEVSDMPRFQYFVSISTAATGDGHTLFASSKLFTRHLPTSYSMVKLQKIRWTCRSKGFFKHVMDDLPLVVPHPTLGTPCVRWHQPWDQWRTGFGHAEISIDNGSQHLIPLVDNLLLDRRVCLRFAWKQGDVLVSDNYAMMHTRTAFDGASTRELWRIHIN